MTLSKDALDKIVNEFKETSSVNTDIIDGVYIEFIERGITTSNDPSYLRFMFSQVVNCAVQSGVK